MGKTEQLLVQTLISKIGPIDMGLVIAADKLPTGKYLIKLGGKRAEDHEIEALKREAEMIENTRLFKMLTETLRYQAEQAMFVRYDEDKRSFESGRLLLHAISTLEHIVLSAKNPQYLTEERAMHTPSSPLQRKSLDSKKQIKR